ncbi:MAG: caspase family protein [Acidobacteria bacterium]|nr:caspase family protein [Acidobacteriota bacterium]
MKLGKAVSISWACAFALALLSSPAAADEKPFLRIETEMQTAGINWMDVDAAGRYLVTGSDDKTVRVWDLQSGELQRVLRSPIGEGDEGKIYAVAISPDGETVAAGGWTGHAWEKGYSVYLFERQSGRLRGRISGLPNVTLHLAFSHDGARLAAALGGANGVRVFKAADGRELGADGGYDDSSYGVDFDAAGRLVTSSFDGQIRLYGPDLKILAQVEAPGGQEPFGIAFSPDGRRIAVGYRDTHRLDVLSGGDLKLLYSADSRAKNHNLATVAWSRDGAFLYAAGHFDKDGMRPIRRWADAGRGPWQDLNRTKNTVRTLRPLADGRLAFASGDPAWGVLDANGKFLQYRRPTLADPLSLEEGFRVTADGKTVGFAYEPWGKRPASFKLPGRRLVLDPPVDGTLTPPRIVAPGLTIEGWENAQHPILNGKPLRLRSVETSRSLAIAADNQSFLLGSEWYLRSFTRSGEELWEKPAPDVAWAVQVTGDGRLAVAAFGDGTIRWYRYRDGQELLAFFPHADGRRWVLWTPSGYYDTSVGGEDLIGWHVNHGLDQAADFFPAWHFRDQYHRPEVIDLILETLDETEAVRRAGILSSSEPTAPAPAPPPILSRLPPVVTVLEPASGAAITTSPVKLRINVRSPSGAPVTAVRARVDGRPISGRGDVVYQPAADTPPQDFYREIEVPVPPRDCSVDVLAEAGGAVSEPARLQLHWAPPAPKLQHRLFVLAVGISKYQNPAFRLDFADRDATDVAAAWKRLGSGSYDSVETHVLTNAQATHGAILDALDELHRKATRDDVTVIFVAGHGINDSGYFFLPYDADLQHRLNTLIPGSLLQDTLLRLQGHVVLFLDTCRAGSLESSTDEVRRRVDATNFLNGLIYSSAGLVVFSAAAERQLSIESADWKHGAFTKVLLEGLAGAADLTKNGTITPSKLETYLKEGVEKLTHEAQTPVANKSSSVPDFVLARVPGRE